MSDLLYRACVHPVRRVTEFPVGIYGHFCSKDASGIVEHWIPFLESELVKMMEIPIRSLCFHLKNTLNDSSECYDKAISHSFDSNQSIYALHSVQNCYGVTSQVHIRFFTRRLALIFRTKTDASKS
jgi:hypothetical protein